MPAAVDVRPGPMSRHVILTVDTRRPLELVDLTVTLSSVVEGLGLVDGVLTVQTRHTTTGLLINEHEPLLHGDFEEMLERLVPSSRDYAHDDPVRRTVNVTDAERRNGHAHLRAALLRTSESIVVAGGALSLGRWQRVFLVECDGPQRREVAVVLSGEGR